MISTDDLNRDVLELIFSNLNPDDLCSVALVSRSFFTAAIPQLYHTLFFRAEQRLKFPVSSPFATVIAHPTYSVHVRAIDVRSIPFDETQKRHTEFSGQITEVLNMCRNLKSFTWPVNSHILHYLENKTGLSELRIAAQLPVDQANRLANFNAIQSLTLFLGSSHTMKALPDWSRSIQRTLTSLVLYYCDTLNDKVLESVLVNLPQLVVLRIVSCSKVSSTTILRLTKYTPMLRSLAMTLSPTILTHLRELVLDVQGVVEDARANFTSFVPYLRQWLPPLSSIHLRSAAALHHTYIRELLEDHATTLKSLALHAPLEVASIMAICSSCCHLVELALPFLIPNFTAFAEAIRSLERLRTLNNTRPPSSPDSRITSEQVTRLLSLCRSLQSVTSDERSWTGYIDAQGKMQIAVQRYHEKNHWVIPLGYLR